MSYFNTSYWHIEVIFSGISFGSLFIFINRFTEKKAFRKRSFGFNILLKSLFYIVSLFIACILLFNSFKLIGVFDQTDLDELKQVFTIGFIISGILYYSIFILIANFIVYISKKFGPGVLIDLLKGKYYHPQNRELVFMFLDLKHSTSIAEKLGHEVYSKFIKECVHDLTPNIQRYRANVYQYVGDEVILYWDLKQGANPAIYLNAFFEFTEYLNYKKTYYQMKYGLSPEYKAGMDSGIVTATEIGDIKREIAFHGDVLNTAARLEKKCNEYDAQLIISQNIHELFSSSKEFSFKFLSDLPLKGKAQNVKFYSVEQL